MSFYQKVAEVGSKFIPRHKLFQHGFNLSPMYRRSTGRIIYVEENLMRIRVKLPISWKNRNYANTIFGGSMFSAVDPIPMVQLIQLLGKGYVVWDKAAQIQFKRPAREHLYAEFVYSESEVEDIRKQVERDREVVFDKLTQLTDKDGKTVFCEVTKTIYVAD